MIRFVIIFLFCLYLISCTDKVYEYTTFDYKSMQIVKSETVLDKTAWVDSVLVDDDIAVVNVLLRGEETKRIFKKKRIIGIRS